MFFFFFNDTATTEIYTLSLHDALPISAQLDSSRGGLAGRDPDAAHRRRSVNTAGDRTVIGHAVLAQDVGDDDARLVDRKSTRLNSSHSQISYAVFCLKKKKHQIHSSTYPLSIHETPYQSSASSGASSPHALFQTSRSATRLLVRSSVFC